MRLNLVSLIVTRRWDEALKRIEEYPHEIIYNEFHETSILHLACSYHAPINVISTLVSLHPELISVQESNLHYTPLHIMSHCHAFGSRAQTDVHYQLDVLRCLLKACPEAVRISATRTGWIPLHVVCGQDDVPLPVLKEMVEADPNTLHVSNFGGVTPMQILCSSFLIKLMDDAIGVSYSALGEGEESTSYACLQDMSPDQIISLVLRKGIDIENIESLPLWDKIQYASRKLFSHNFLNDEESLAPLLHSIAGTKILRDIVSVALALYSFELQVYSNEGLIPLHIAILTNGCKCEHEKNPTKYRCACNTNKTPIDMFVQACPQTAKIPFKDDKYEGRLPLNIAIENRIRWSNGVRSIFRAAPEVVRIRDVSTKAQNNNAMTKKVYNGTGLYPFMLAATVTDNTKSYVEGGKMEQSNDPEEIEAIYELLRASPDLLMMSNIE